MKAYCVSILLFATVFFANAKEAAEKIKFEDMVSGNPPTELCLQDSGLRTWSVSIKKDKRTYSYTITASPDFRLSGSNGEEIMAAFKEAVEKVYKKKLEKVDGNYPVRAKAEGFITIKTEDPKNPITMTMRVTDTNTSNEALNNEVLKTQGILREILKKKEEKKKQ